MDDKSEVEFFKILLKQNVQMPVLETALITGNGIEAVIHTDESGFVKIKNEKSLVLTNYLQRTIGENEVKSKVLRLNNPKLLYFTKHGKRKAYSELEIKEIINKKRVPISSNLIQKINISLFSKEFFILAKLLYLNKQFQVTFTHDNVSISDPIINSHLIDMLSLIVSALETSELKRVVHLEVEFLKDSFHSLWLSNCIKCHLIEARHVFKPRPFTEEELSQLCKSVPKFTTQKIIKSKTTSRRSSIYSAEYSEFSEFYLFKRGQLRNLDSNLNSPIRYIAPEFDYEEINLDDGPYLNNKDSTQDSLKLKRISDSENFNFYSNSHKNYNLKESLYSELHELSRSFSKEDVSKIKMKKFTEAPKRVTLTEHLRKSAFAKTPNNVKSLPKLKSNQKYGNYFMELVLNTYCKKDLRNQNKLGEFGLGTMVTCEEFSNFISKVDGPNAKGTLRAAARSMIDEYFSRNPSPCPDYVERKKSVTKIGNLVKTAGRNVKKAAKSLIKKKRLTPILSPKNSIQVPLIKITNTD